MSQLLTIDEVAEELRLPLATLYYWRSIRKGPKSTRLGGRRIVYRRRDVEAWIADAFEAEA